MHIYILSDRTYLYYEVILISIVFFKVEKHRLVFL